jgi:hypothetical protein
MFFPRGMKKHAFPFPRFGANPKLYALFRVLKCIFTAITFVRLKACLNAVFKGDVKLLFGESKKGNIELWEMPFRRQKASFETSKMRFRPRERTIEALKMRF